MEKNYCPIKLTYRRLGHMGTWINSVFYEPEDIAGASSIAVLAIHSDGDYLNFSAGPELARRGYRTLCANTSGPKPLDKKLLDVNECVNYLRSLPGIDKVVILGHSGGATLMSAFQAAAENGPEIFQGDNMIVPCGDIGPMTPADGVMLLDSNFGNGAMTLLSVDPAVKDDACGTELDPEFDLASPEFGYSPSGACYSEEFIARYQKAQARRNNLIIDKALRRLAAIENGGGNFTDDEPFIIAGAAQIAPCNRMFPQDIRLLAHTKGEWPLLHADGSETVEIVRSVRRPRPAQAITSRFGMSAVQTTVREYLASRAVRALPEFGYDATGVYGIDWSSSFCCTPGNVMHIKAPMLIMGMTAGYEFLAAEVIYENSASRDKSLAFVEGATHIFTPGKDCEQYPGQFGDTVKTLFDHVAAWLNDGHV